MGRRKNREREIIEDVRVLDFASEGKALARVNDKVLFVPYAASGDLIDVEISRSKPNYMEGRILKIKEFSPLRQEAFCEHFGICGGCKWQHIKYEEQLLQKQKQIIDHLERIAKVELPVSMPIVASEEITYYRNKLEFTFCDRRWFTNEEIKSDEELEDKSGLGFHLAGKFDRILDIKHCYLQPEPSNRIRLFIKEFTNKNNILFYNVRKAEGFLRSIIIRNNSKGEFMLILVIKENNKELISLILDAVKAEFPEIVSLMYIINGKLNDSISDLEVELFSGKPYIEEFMYEYAPSSIGSAQKKELKFRIGPKSFYQTNAKQAYNLYKLAAEMAEANSNDIVYDLYTGTGTIALFIANSVKKVIGIEYVKEAIDDAFINAKENAISNVNFFAGDMAKVLTDEFIAQNEKPDIIITDPPREGMHEKVVEQILKIKPKRIVYVSCNSATQARDIALLDKLYKIEKHRAVDMFPHTFHVESVALLILKN